MAFWSVNRAHQSDIGGSTHGAYNPGATEIWQEGIRITPLKLYDAGELRDDVMQMIVTNVRHPHDFMGDLRAMIGSARVGERRLLSLVDDYGAKTVIDCGRRDPGRRRAPGAGVRAHLEGRRLSRRDACWTTTATAPSTSPSARRSPRRATRLTIDLSESSPQVTGFINSAFPNTMSAVHMAFAYLIDPRTPKNSGTFRPVKVIAQAGHDRASQPAGAGDARRPTTARRRSPSRSSRR